MLKRSSALQHSAFSFMSLPVVMIVRHGRTVARIHGWKQHWNRWIPSAVTFSFRARARGDLDRDRSRPERARIRGRLRAHRSGGTRPPPNCATVVNVCGLPPSFLTRGFSHPLQPRGVRVHCARTGGRRGTVRGSRRVVIAWRRRNMPNSAGGDVALLLQAPDWCPARSRRDRNRPSSRLSRPSRSAATLGWSRDCPHGRDAQKRTSGGIRTLRIAHLHYARRAKRPERRLRSSRPSSDQPVGDSLATEAAGDQEEMIERRTRGRC